MSARGVVKWVRCTFALDVRSLALWRVTSAVLLLADVAWRARDGDVYALLTDWGVWPAAHATQWNAYIVSLHFASGTPAFQALMLCLSAACSLCLLVGYRTRLASFFSWALLTSLHNRNQMTQNAGDEYFRLLLLCSVFLPLGSCFSVDSALDLAPESPTRAPPYDDKAHKKTNAPSAASPRYRFLSGWTFAFMFQVLILYVCTALLKTGEAWWNGQAVYYALSLDVYATRLGLFIRQFPFLTALLTWGTISFEWIGPMLLVFPVHSELVRLLAVVGFCLLHLGFGSCLTLGLFMWIPQAAMCALLPPLFWDHVMHRLQTPARRGLRIYYADEALLFVRIMCTFFLLPGTKVCSLGHTALAAARADGSEVNEEELGPRDVEDQTNARGASWDRGQQWLVAVNHRGEVTRGREAVLCILARSPLLFALPPIVRLLRRLLAQLGCCPTTSHQRRSGGALRPALRVPWRRNKWRRNYTGWRQHCLAVLFVLFTLNWNAALEPGRAYFDGPLVQIVGSVLRLDQFWGMFAPFPLIEDGWYQTTPYLFTGFRLTGDETGDLISLAKPDIASDFYPSQRWSKLFDNLRPDSADLLRLGFGRYICREWNLHAGNPPEKRLVRFDMDYMAELTLPDQRTAPIERLTLWRHLC
ncbi:HTTM, putative [Acanthamoeba castellanii str. Neff]|uniref:HTTM, putative n=1 Tax=Acanthamoeba castellanii (strain ATCC 30010 / Neff) TaxID=1257118 RepID=L8HER4_ACACF|nr:HTTM, putative [Acanthamoeba castellanii str. Neff]ELR23258.1 HTTM, putative [Acanthamoeba castellanii str. Neff]